MYKEFFTKLAEKENGKFYFRDRDLAFGDGSRSPDVIFKVVFDNEGHVFTIYNRIGTVNEGNIRCELAKHIQAIPFEIDSIPHIQNLFLRKKSRFKVKTKDQGFKKFLVENEHLEVLSKLAIRENFSPMITCEKGGNWRIEAKYHLEFDDWIMVLEPMIGFYKDLIEDFRRLI